MSLECSKCKRKLKVNEEVFQLRSGYIYSTDEGVEFEPEEERELYHVRCRKI